MNHMAVMSPNAGIHNAHGAFCWSEHWFAVGEGDDTRAKETASLANAPRAGQGKLWPRREA